MSSGDRFLLGFFAFSGGFVVTAFLWVVTVPRKLPPIPATPENFAANFSKDTWESVVAASGCRPEWFTCEAPEYVATELAIEKMNFPGRFLTLEQVRLEVAERGYRLVSLQAAESYRKAHSRPGENKLLFFAGSSVKVSTGEQFIAVLVWHGSEGWVSYLSWAGYLFNGDRAFFAVEKVR